MKKLEIQFNTLTPIWTGGAERDSERIRETGLVGSLRWWYEGIVRGMGGKVCNAVEDGCILEQKDGSNNDVDLCPACRLFGCTGWRRRFRLDAHGLEPQDLFFVASRGVYVAAGNWLWRMFGGEELGGRKQGRGAAVTFDFGVQTLWGEQATLRVIPFGKNTEDTLARVAFLLDRVARWGALGAKPQHGFGQIQVVAGLEPDLIAQGESLAKADAQETAGKALSNASPDFFNQSQFFSHIYRLPSIESYLNSTRTIGTPPPRFHYRNHFIPCAFDIRYKSRSRDFRTGAGQDFGMRPWFREKWDKNVTHRLFGRSDARRDDERAAGRIHVSHLYRTESDRAWHLKVWGHVPSDLRNNQGQGISVRDVADQVDNFVASMFSDSSLVARFESEEVLKP